MVSSDVKGAWLAQPLLGDSPSQNMSASNSWAFQRASLGPRVCSGVCLSLEGSSAAGDSRAHSSTNALTLRDRVGSKRHFKTLLNGDTRSFVHLSKQHLAACRAMYYAPVKPSQAIYIKQILHSYVCVFSSLQPLGHISGLWLGFKTTVICPQCLQGLCCRATGRCAWCRRDGGTGVNNSTCLCHAAF